MASTIEIPEGWQKLVGDIDATGGVVLVMGAPDTGKTTLAWYLGKALAQNKSRVAVIYADMGQCAFGPPASIGMTFMTERLQEMEETSPQLLYFIGSTSPVGHLLQTVVGLKKLVERAYTEGAEVVVVDTTGFVLGGAAWELKFQKIIVTNPGHLVAVQRAGEIEHILQPHDSRRGITVHRLPVHEKVRVKSPEERRRNRTARFKEYFKNTKPQRLSLEGVKVISPYNAFLAQENKHLLERLLVGLNDDDNFCLAMAILLDMDRQAWHATLLTPMRELEGIKIMRLGSIKIDTSWQDSKAGQGER